MKDPDTQMRITTKKGFGALQRQTEPIRSGNKVCYGNEVS